MFSLDRISGDFSVLCSSIVRCVFPLYLHFSSSRNYPGSSTCGPLHVRSSPISPFIRADTHLLSLAFSRLLSCRRPVIRRLAATQHKMHGLFEEGKLVLGSIMVLESCDPVPIPKHMTGENTTYSSFSASGEVL